MNAKALSLLGLVMTIAGLVILFLRQGLFSPSPILITLQVAAGLLMIWARLTFGARSFHAAANPTEGKLVTSGPYRFVRHPIYAAILLFTWASVLAHFSVINALLGLLVTLGTATRIYCEERELRRRYPEYEAYARRTRRVIPGII